MTSHSHVVIGDVTIRLSIDDLLHVLNRNQTHILLSLRDIQRQKL